MTSLLSSADLAQLERTLRTALGPADHGSAAAWGAELCAAAGALVGEGAIGSVLVMSDDAVHRILHTDLPADAVRAYREEFVAHDVMSARVLGRRLPVAYELDVLTPEELRGSTMYNEFSLRYQLPCNFGVSAYRAGGAPHRLMLTFTHWPDDAVRERATAVLRTLAPAFTAGVESVGRLTAVPGELARVLDLLAEPTLVCDRRGSVLHQNPALGALLADVCARGGTAAEAPVHAELRALAGGLGALLGARGAVRGGAVPPAAAREFGAAGQRLRARACFTAEDTLARDALVWVTVERVEARGAGGATASAFPVVSAPADDAVLRTRYGLTAQECTVARLLAGRRTDAEVGAALGISPHTARTHAERVRRKLGVTRRTDVAAALAAG